MNTRMKGIFTLLSVLMIVALLLSGCTAATAPQSAAPAAEQADPAAETLKVGISTDAGFDARIAEANGIYALAKELGNVEVIEQIADNDPQKQTQQIRALVDQGVDAISVAAIDMNTVGPALEYAAEKGVIVTTYDRFLDYDVIQFAAGYDSLSDGKKAGELIKSMDDGQPHVVFELVGPLNDPNAIARRDGFHSVVDELTNLTVVQIPTDWDTDKALSGVQNALQKHPDVWAIFNASDHMDTSVDTALKEKGLLTKVDEEVHVKRVSLAGTLPGYTSAVNGYVDYLLVIPLDQMGRPILEAIIKLKNGEAVDSDRHYVETFPLKGSEVEANKDRIWGYVYKDRVAQ